MKLKDFHVPIDKVDPNYKLYLYLKELNWSPKVTDTVKNELIKIIYTYKDTSEVEEVVRMMNEYLEKYVKNGTLLEKLSFLLTTIKTLNDIILFVFSLKLLDVKEWLLSEAKLATTNIITKTSQNSHPLSVQYDSIWKNSVYMRRVHWALLSLLFFQMLEQWKQLHSDDAQEFIDKLVEESLLLKTLGIEPNQMFMIMFTEAVNQSAVSSAWTSYEDRILQLLLGFWLKSEQIKKVHDKNDKSTEYDFFFEIDGKTVGIWAKRTLRERYKQFIKTAHAEDIDLIVEITLGLDLTYEKAVSIRKHDTILFIADEIYACRSDLQGMEGVYKWSDFSLNLIRELLNK